MSIVIVSHSVADYEKWRPAFDEDASRREAAGLKTIMCGQKSDDANMIYAIFETENPEAIHKMFDDPELKEKMQAAGVTSAPEIIIVN